MTRTFLDGRVNVKVGDITAEAVDAIVNAANRTLLGGGGVDGAIHRIGGPQILADCKRIRELLYPSGLPTGMAVITTAGDLDAEYVIHTVGPIYGEDPDTEAELLADCYLTSIGLASDANLKSISFPSISTGAFGYPKHLAAPIASAAILKALGSETSVEMVNLVFFSESDAAMFLKHSKF